MSRDLYATIAQVLPVVLLALVWESRFLETLRGQQRLPRSQDPEHGVRFWTKPRVRIYGLSVATIITLDITACVLVLSGIIPDSHPLRGIVISGLVLALASLLTRIWFDVLRATDANNPDEAPTKYRNR